MNGRVQTQVEELADNRVRLTVEVPRDEVRHAVEHAASDLAETLKIPGFRKGKVPVQIVRARLGKRLMNEAVESHIGGWFWNAAARSRIQPVAQPEYEFDVPESDHDDWSFTATVEVQPKPEVADWTSLEVPRRDAEVPDELIQQELDVLRAAVAELAPVDGRAAQLGDVVVIDLVTHDGEATRDYVVELGGGRLLEEIEAALVGMAPGESKDVTLTGEDEQAQHVVVTVKGINERVLPPLDDELARAASEFETLAELRADIESTLREQLEDVVESEFRAAAVDRLVEASSAQAAGPLVEARTRELVNGLARSLEARGISLDTYLRLTGGSAEQLVERMRADASRAVARELVLGAVADNVGIAVDDDALDDFIRTQAGLAGEDPDAALEHVRAAGTRERIREDLRLRAALDRIAAEVKPISAGLARARERLWTPEQEQARTPADAKLWTPGTPR